MGKGRKTARARSLKSTYCTVQLYCYSTGGHRTSERKSNHRQAGENYRVLGFTINCRYRANNDGNFDTNSIFECYQTMKTCRISDSSI